MAGHTHIPAPRNTIETYSSRPEREPPRNDNGDIICQHEACRDKSEIFRRPCEWNKHMDKHERPYKCSEPTCEQNPGFTYSGGLLRHMREVHKKGVGPTRRPLFCPHANCIRSTGEGFTRRENLEEHLRRRHSYTGHYSPPPPSTSDNNEETQDQPRKRRKTVDPESPNDEQRGQQGQHLTDSRRESRTDPALLAEDRAYANGNDADLDRTEAINQIHVLRQTILDQQERIRQQDYEIQHLRMTLQTGSPNAAYSTRPPTALAVQMPQQDSLLAESVPPLPQINGNAHAPPVAVQDDSVMQNPESPSQQQKADSQSNGNEPSRRIEIARDLVSEKQQAAAQAA